MAQQCVGKRFSKEIAEGVKRSTEVLQQLALEGLRDKLDAMVPLVQQVMKQTRARIVRGDTRSDGKLVSLFEPSTEIIRKGKAGKPTIDVFVQRSGRRRSCAARAASQSCFLLPDFVAASGRSRS